jgi:hypothetical protein
LQNLAKNSLLIVGFLFAIALLVLGLSELRTLLIGAEATVEPQAVNATGITSNSATINFTTKKQASALISYGSDPSSLSLFSAEPSQTLTHAVTLSFLSPSTKYFYTIKIGNDVFDNNGTPYEFTTKPAAQGSSGAVGTQFENLNPETFKQKFGSSDQEYDLNRDGIVNSTDYLLYLKKTQSD